MLAIAETGSTVKAAARLHVTQSAVSRGLLHAEDKLGAPLFVRTSRGLLPTPVGERLLPGATALLAQLVELERAARAPVDERVQMRIVCECYTAYRWLPSTVATLRQRLARFDLTLAFEHTRDPVSALLADEVDIALVTTARVRGGLGERPLFSDEVVFVVASSHPLAARAALTVDDLCDHPLIVSSNTPEPERRWFAARAFGQRRPRADALRFPLTEAMIDATRAGMGIAVMSEWIAQAYTGDGGLVVKRLRGRPLRRPWRIVFRKQAAPHAAELATALASLAPRLYASAG